MFCGWVASTLCRVLPSYKISYSFVMISNFFLEAVSISWIMVWVGCTSCLSGLSSCIALFGHLYCNQTLQKLASVASPEVSPRSLTRESHQGVSPRSLTQGGLTREPHPGVSPRESHPPKGIITGETVLIVTLEAPRGTVSLLYRPSETTIPRSSGPDAGSTEILAAS